MSYSHKLRYTDYLSRVQARGSYNAKSQLRKILKVHHLRAWKTTAGLAALGGITYAFGLHISCTACLVLSLLVFGSDFINWIVERRAGF